MFYSLVFTLYPIWILLQQKNAVFHNKNNLKSVIISNDLEQSVSNNCTEDTSIVFIKQNQNHSNGFDLHLTTVSYSETSELRKIANYFRKLKQFKLLNSPFVSDICKLKCAQEVLEEAREEEETYTYKIKKNDFWETYDDMFF
jgi:hypothetical protein